MSVVCMLGLLGCLETSDLADHSEESRWQWVAVGGGRGTSPSVGIAVDSSGSVHIVGFHNALVDFDGVSLQPKGQINAFLATYSPDGRLIRAQTYGDDGRVSFEAVAASSEQLFIGGNIGPRIPPLSSGRWHIGTTELESELPLGFLAALDYDGQPRWAFSFKGTGGSIVRAVGVGSDGRATVVGQHIGALHTIGPSGTMRTWSKGEGSPPPYLIMLKTKAGFVARVSAEGEAEWIELIEAAGTGAAFMIK